MRGCVLSPLIPDGNRLKRKQASQGREEGLPAGLRITQPALALAHRLKIDLNQLPQNQLITEDTLRRLEQPGPIVSPETGKIDLPDFQGTFDPTAIIVYGAGGHGKTVIELLRAMGTYRLVGIVDDDPDLPGSISGVPILGGAEILPRLKSQGVRLAANAVGGIGNLQVRIGIFRNLADAGFHFPAVAHPRAFLEPSARLSPGVQVFAQAYVGCDAEIGFGSIINTGAIISHDCLLGTYVNISPGAILAGQVQVEEAVLIGMGATLNLQVRVGKGARIGNGATVKADVPAGAVVKAGAVWPG